MQNNLLEKVIYISNEDYETLVSAGTVTIGGKTLTYDENIVYITPEKAATIAEDGLMSAEDKAKLDAIERGAQANVQADWNVTDSSSDAYIKNKPSIPTVNDGTLTIQKNGTNVQTFTANQSSNVTANISVPTKVTDLIDASQYLNISATSQAKSGNLTLIGNTYIGDGTSSARAVGDAPYQTKFLDFATRTGVLKHLNVFSGVGDHFYNADQKSEFTIRSTFKGNGSDSDTYKADFYTWGVDDMGYYITYLFDWNLNYGWCVLPSKVSTSTPAIIEIKCGSRINYTDVLRLVLTGHNGYDGSNNYSGILNDYTIEVCTDYTNNTWVTVVNRSNVTDKIGSCPQYSLQTSSYTACFGIRLKITRCAVTGSGHQYVKITSIQLRNHRPDFNVPESIGALSLRGGTVYGDILMGSKNGNSIRPTANNKGNVGSSSYQFNRIYGQTLYENGTSLVDKYLGKTAKAADSDKLDGNDSSYFQKALPTTATAGKVLKSTSTAGTVEWADDSEIDAEFSLTSANPVQNKVISAKLNGIDNAITNLKKGVFANDITLASASSYTGSAKLNFVGRSGGSSLEYNDVDTALVYKNTNNNAIKFPAENGTLATQEYVNKAISDAINEIKALLNK